MHIALFGASFDPPHIAHKLITETLINQKLADEVWLVPVKDHPFGKNLSDEKIRLAMLKLMVETISIPDKVRIEEFELEQDQPSYSFQTLSVLSQKYPEHTFSWVIGSDNLAHFSEWFQVKQLLEKFTVYVYPREGSEHDQLLAGMTLIANVPEVAVSSTLIRENIREGVSIDGLVEPNVAQYIKENGLYVK
ncbi:nicotinate-nucleotide adenylyltransferase [soil metagenome]